MCIPGVQHASLGLVALAFTHWAISLKSRILYLLPIHTPAQKHRSDSPAGAEKRGFKLKPFQGEQKLLTVVALSSSFEEAGAILTLSLLENTVKGVWGIDRKTEGMLCIDQHPLQKEPS